MTQKTEIKTGGFIEIHKLILKAMDLKPGDEVLMQTFSFDTELKITKVKKGADEN